MTEMEQRLEQLERRVRHLEDEAAVRQLVSTYGPLVDSGSADAVAELWSVEGTYDYQSRVPPLEGQEAIRAMVRSDAHQRFLGEGCGHVVTAPHVEVEGDEAVATCYSLLVRHQAEGEGWRVTRLSANRWELHREDAEWRVTRRVNRLLDGGVAGRELLAIVVDGSDRGGQ